MTSDTVTAADRANWNLLREYGALGLLTWLVDADPADPEYAATVIDTVRRPRQRPEDIDTPCPTPSCPWPGPRHRAWHCATGGIARERELDELQRLASGRPFDPQARRSRHVIEVRPKTTSTATANPATDELVIDDVTGFHIDEEDSNE